VITAAIGLSRPPACASCTGCTGPSSPCRSHASSAWPSSGVIEGIFIAVALALLDFIRRAWRPRTTPVPGPRRRPQGLPRRHPPTPTPRRFPGLVLFRWDAPLFFANAEVFADEVREAIASSPTPVRWVVVARRTHHRPRRHRRRRAQGARRGTRRPGHRLCASPR
jgi:hypothetical protein